MKNDNAKYKIIDVSLPIHKKMLMYPKNPMVSIKPLRTPHSFLSEITFGSHTGTHVDAPRHVFSNGTSVDRIDPARFIGPCRVLDMAKVRRAITVANLAPQHIRAGERILAKTRNSLRGYKKFHRDYVYLDGDAASFLAKKRIALFGIDYLSVKKQGSADNRPHTELLKKGIPIFEGLDLSRVKPGRYFFVGLPLKFVGLDGAPARAFLLDQQKRRRT